MSGDCGGCDCNSDCNCGSNSNSTTSLFDCLWRMVTCGGSNTVVNANLPSTGGTYKAQDEKLPINYTGGMGGYNG
jgi:hypothetical protein